MNVEEDEAGKLSAFRSRFGRNWDQDGKKTAEEVRLYARADYLRSSTNTLQVAEDTKAKKESKKDKVEDEDQGLDLLMDLISGSAANIPAPKGSTKPKKKK
jgi:hypothetical protein